MKATIVVMLPTVNRAANQWESFLLTWPAIIKKANRTNLYIELLNGHKIYFKGETEGPRALLGLHADIVSAEKFEQIKAKMCELKGKNK